MSLTSPSNAFQRKVAGCLFLPMRALSASAVVLGMIYGVGLMAFVCYGISTKPEIREWEFLSAFVWEFIVHPDPSILLVGLLSLFFGFILFSVLDHVLEWEVSKRLADKWNAPENRDGRSKNAEN